MRRSCLLIVVASLLAGCAGPRPLGSSPGEMERVIHVDGEGNITRGGAVPDHVRAKQDEIAERARNLAAKQDTAKAGEKKSDAETSAPTDKPAPAANDSSANTDGANFGELAAALHQNGVNADRIEQMISAHQRTPDNGAHSAEQFAPASVPQTLVPQTSSLQTLPPQGAGETQTQLAGHRQSVTRGSELDASYLPAGVEPSVVNSLRFDLEYDDKVLGPGGIAKVELFGTRDGGRSWQKLGEDRDRRSPYTIEMPSEGLYGFRIAVQGKSGLASRPPKPGEPPELWVSVDLSQPLYRGNLRPAGEEESAEEVATAEPNAESDSSTAASQEVQLASHTEPAAPTNIDAITWRENLARAIAQLEAELQESESADSPSDKMADPNGASAAAAHSVSLSPEERARRAAQLRMLYAAASRHDEAVSSSPHLSTRENEYWSHQMHGLKLLLEPQDRLTATRRASAALAELQQASDQLAALGELEIRSLAFVTSAQSYGIFETVVNEGPWKGQDYRKRRFEPEQPVLLYFEIMNFSCEQVTGREYPDGAWRTSLRGSYTIVDEGGKPVERRELKLQDDICQNRRRDYFVAYKAWIPQLNPGRYWLELMVEDNLGKKIGTSSIDFEVVSRQMP